MAPNTRDHSNTLRSKTSNNMITSLANRGITSNELVDTLNISVKNKWVTTKQTIEHIIATIEGWVSTRIYCDKEIYKGMYQKALAQWTILKHQIETINKDIHMIKKRPSEWVKITQHYYKWLCTLLALWEKKVTESAVYPEQKIWFDTQDWNKETEWLLNQVAIMENISHKVNDILYMNQLA